MGLGRVAVVLFLLLPLIEIAGFVLVGNAIGLWPTLAGVLLTGALGALVLRWQGVAVLRDMQRQINNGLMPARAVADTALIGVAGFLLLLPGYFTDILGLLLLLPPVRHGLYSAVRSRIKVVPVTGRSFYGTPPDQPETIELDHDDYRQR